jgi:hypothetical protein
MNFTAFYSYLFCNASIGQYNKLHFIPLLVFVKVRQEIVIEYEHVKDISQTLANFKKDTVHFGGMRHGHEEPTRDPDVWPPPTPVERDNRLV